MTGRSGSTTTEPVVELLWFADCPNHGGARSIIRDVMARHGLTATLVDVDATDPAVAASHRFPGSPTVRVNGVDVEPHFVDPGDYTPRCRLYRIRGGLGGLPDAAWVEDALLRAAGERRGARR